jgi:hypothetical protein
MLSKHQQSTRLASPSFRRVLPSLTMGLDALIVHQELKDIEEDEIDDE